MVSYDTFAEVCIVVTDPIRAVILDLGDTLIHLDKPWEEVFQVEVEALYDYLIGVGAKADFQEFSTAFVRAFEESTSKSQRYKIEIPIEEIIAKVMGMFGVHKPYQRLMQGALEEYHRPELQLWQLYPDSLETLATLEKEGYQLGLISNANSDWAVNAILRKFDIHKFFKIILTSAALRIRKPRPAIFLKALDALKTLPRETVFVGDSFDADVIGARNVGIHAFHLRRKPIERVILVEPEVTVTSLSEVVKIINSWAKTA